MAWVATQSDGKVCLQSDGKVRLGDTDPHCDCEELTPVQCCEGGLPDELTVTISDYDNTSCIDLLTSFYTWESGSPNGTFSLPRVSDSNTCNFRADFSDVAVMYQRVGSCAGPVDATLNVLHILVSVSVLGSVSMAAYMRNGPLGTYTHGVQIFSGQAAAGSYPLQCVDADNLELSNTMTFNGNPVGGGGAVVTQ